MKGAKSVDEAHFLSFTAVVSAWDEKEGFNFHICDTIVTRSKMSGNRLGVVVDRLLYGVAEITVSESVNFMSIVSCYTRRYVRAHSCQLIEENFLQVI